MNRPATFKEKARITVGAVAALIIVGWIVVLAIMFFGSIGDGSRSTRPSIDFRKRLAPRDATEHRRKCERQ